VHVGLKVFMVFDDGSALIVGDQQRDLRPIALTSSNPLIYDNGCC
jgi:hypothetical protein